MRDRFADREDLGRDAVFDRFVAPLGLSRPQVDELFDFVEEEFGVPGGLLRPDDSIGMLLRPLPAGNLWTSWGNEQRAGDRQLALHMELTERWKKLRGRDPHPHVSTIGDLVRAWGGV
jgi:hypothetical protein